MIKMFLFFYKVVMYLHKIQMNVNNISHLTYKLPCVL